MKYRVGFSPIFQSVMGFSGPEIYSNTAIVHALFVLASTGCFCDEMSILVIFMTLSAAAYRRLSVSIETL